MSLLGRPIIFLPGTGEWDSCRRRRAAGMPRRNFRRRPYPTPVTRHPLEDLFDVDPFQDLFVEEYPEESLYEMRDVPSRYISLEPRRLYVYKMKNDPDSKKPIGQMVKKARHVPQARKGNDTGTKKQMNGKNAKSVLMDLDQLVSELFNSFYGVGNRSRSQQKPGDTSSKKVQDQGGEKKTEEKSNGKMSEMSGRQPIKEDTVASNIKPEEVEMNNSEAKETENHKTSTERNIVINQDVEENDEPRTDDIEVVYFIDNSTPKEEEDEGVGNDSLMDTQEDAREMEPEDVDSASHEENSNEVQEKDTETSHPAEVHEQVGGKVLEKNQSMKVEDPGKFQMDIDLRSFLPEEIQVKLSDDKLILNAVHEVIREGLIEKHSIEKVLSLPPSVDPDSLRCRLGEDGHMTISANYVEKSKSKILTIEKHTD